MSDELTIQAVNQPQVQQKKNSTTPYTVGGAVVGGLAGAGINSWVKKPMSWEDVVKEAKDTTDFSTKAEPASWEGVKKEAQKVADLEAKLKNVPEKTLADDVLESKNLKEAIEKRDNEFKRLVEIEKNKGERLSSKFPTKETLQNELTNKEYKMFEPYYNRYQNAKTKLVGKSGAKYAGGSVKPLYNNINAEKGKVNTMYNDFYNIYNALSDKAKENYDPLKKGTATAKKINTTVDSILPEKFGSFFSGHPKYDAVKQYQERFGEELFEFVDKDPGSVTGKSKFKITNPKGKAEWVLIDKDALSSKREALRNEYAENIKNFIDNQKEINGYNKKFLEANKDALANDLRRGIKKEADLARLGQPKDMKTMLNSLEVLETALNNGTIKYGSKEATILGIGTIKNANEFNVLKMQVQAQKDLAESYTKGLGQLKASQQAIVRGDVRVDSAIKKFQNAVNEDKGVKAAIDSIEKLNGKYATDEQKALYAKIKGLLGTEAKGSTADIETKVRDMMKDGSFEKNVKTAQEAYDKALASKGTANTAAKEAIEKELNAAKDSLKQKATELGQKFKKGGTNKWVAAGIGAVIGAAALYGIAASKNKKTV